MRIVHGVGTGSSGTAIGLNRDSPAVMQLHEQLGADEQGRALVADQLDALKETRIGGRRRIDGAKCAIGEADGGAHHVLGLHAMDVRRRCVAFDRRDRPRETQHEIECVNALREQHTTTVSLEGTPPRLVVVVLGPPEPDGGRTPDDLAEFAVCQNLGEPYGGGPEPVLQHDAELDAGLATGGDRRLGPLRRDLHRLFEQHMLARCGAALGQLRMRVGRRDDQHRVHGPVVKDRFQPVRQRKRKAICKSAAARLAGREGVRDFDLIGEIDQALGMWGHAHAEAEDGDAGSGHWQILTARSQGPNHSTGSMVMAGT